MARAARNTKLENRTNRLQLKKGKRYFVKISKGLWVVYRRTGEGYGTWAVKMAQPGGTYALQALKPADDHQDADGVTVLDFYQAQDAARDKAEEAKQRAGILIKPRSVKDAAERYLAWYRQHRRAVKETEHTINVHILPVLGDKRLADLTSSN